MTGNEPEVPLARAGLVLVLGGLLVGLGLGWMEPGSSMSHTSLLGGGLLIVGGLVATLRTLYRHWKDRS